MHHKDISVYKSKAIPIHVCITNQLLLLLLSTLLFNHLLHLRPDILGLKPILYVFMTVMNAIALRTLQF